MLTRADRGDDVRDVLQAPVDALEGGERALRIAASLDAQLGRDRDRGERIAHVVLAGKIERHRERCGRGARSRQSASAALPGAG